MHPYYHALSSVKKFGGRWVDYLEIHAWFDETKSLIGDARHRALRHHTAGIFWCEERFGRVIYIGQDGETKPVPTRLVAEQHVMEDMGFLPTPEWWLKQMALAPEMNRVPIRSSDITVTPPSREHDTPIETLKQRLATELYKGEG